MKHIAHDPSALLQWTRLQLECRRHTTASLARALGVSTATAFRLVKRLRASGVDVVSRKEGREWYYGVRAPQRTGRDPIFSLVGIARGAPPKGESVDDAVYGRKRAGR